MDGREGLHVGFGGSPNAIEGPADDPRGSAAGASTWIIVAEGSPRGRHAVRCRSEASNFRGTSLDNGGLPFSGLYVETGTVTPTVSVGNKPYESMLCEVDTVTVSIMNPDAPKDYDEFTITDASTGGLRVDDYLFDPLDNTYPVGTAFSKVIGIAGFSFTNRKIYPCSMADLPP